MTRYETTQSDFIAPGTVCFPIMPEVLPGETARLIAVNWIQNYAEIQIHPDGYNSTRWMVRDVIGYFVWTWEVM